MQVLVSPMLLDEANSLWPCLRSWPFYTMGMSQKGPCSIMALNWGTIPHFSNKTWQDYLHLSIHGESPNVSWPKHHVSSSSMVQIMWNPSNSLFWGPILGQFFPIFFTCFPMISPLIMVNLLFPSRCRAWPVGRSPRGSSDSNVPAMENLVGFSEGKATNNWGNHGKILIWICWLEGRSLILKLIIW